MTSRSKHLPAFLEEWPLDRLRALRRARYKRRDAFLWHPRAVIELRELIAEKEKTHGTIEEG